MKRSSSEDEAAIVEVYQAWCRAFQSVDAEGMKALFDRDFPGLVYQSEENKDPMYTWAEIDEYWTNAVGLVARIPVWRELSRKIAVDGDAAWIYAKLDTRLEINGAKKPLLGELRASIGLRRTASGWKIVHYHEGRHVDLAFLFQD